ncbi:branched-chain amino acid ABC transporter permease [Castellaniella sp.]|uniref:branched-chain amino acid ABC transporter permease n=1 Tax=Castellaniella sp. TaxID=1955812 RepID=UPI00356933E0
MNRRFLLVGLLVVIALVAAPLVMSQSLINAGIQMLIASLFACAFSLLCGQAGMLSFGHSAFFGAGAFATVHAMDAMGGAGLLPTPFMPLVGAVTGLLVGLVAGWFATKRTGVYFAMITLAIGELLYALAPHLSGWFGGEAGLSTMRMPAFGLSFADNVQVYYLTLAWVLLCLGLLYLFMRTPLGRVALGLRENTHRMRFFGYNVHVASTLVFAISTMFSGVAGALQAINIESANYVIFNLDLSAQVLLNSYIGGVTYFLGPAVGAALMSFFGYVVSDLTTSWLLYQGLLFVLVMLFMPRGIAGLVHAVAQALRRCGFARLWRAFALYLGATALLVAGTTFLVELLQRLFSQDYRALSQIGGNAWPDIPLFGASWAPLSVLTWLLPVLLLTAGIWLLARAARHWRRALALAAPDDDSPATTGGGRLVSGASS